MLNTSRYTEYKLMLLIIHTMVVLDDNIEYIYIYITYSLHNIYLHIYHMTMLNYINLLNYIYTILYILFVI